MNGGVCQYGAGSPFGICGCQKFRKMRGGKTNPVCKCGHALVFHAKASDLTAALTEVAKAAEALAAACKAAIGVAPTSNYAEPPTTSDQLVHSSPLRPPPDHFERREKPAATATKKPTNGAPALEGDLPPGEKRVLIAVVQRRRHSSTGEVDRPYISAMTGYASSTRNTYLQRLVARGLVSYGESDAIVVATSEGVDAAGDYEQLPIGAALCEYWLGRLPIGEASVLRAILRAWPVSITREAISTATDFATSTRNTYIQRLSRKHLVEELGRDAVRASPWFFKEPS